MYKVIAYHYEISNTFDDFYEDNPIGKDS